MMLMRQMLDNKKATRDDNEDGNEDGDEDEEDTSNGSDGNGS